MKEVVILLEHYLFKSISLKPFKIGLWKIFIHFKITNYLNFLFQFFLHLFFFHHIYYFNNLILLLPFFCPFCLFKPLFFLFWSLFCLFYPYLFFLFYSYLFFPFYPYLFFFYYPYIYLFFTLYNYFNDSHL